MVRIALHNRLDAPGIEQIVLAFLEMQGDFGAARLPGDVLDTEFAAAVRFPAHRQVRRQTGTVAHQGHLVSNDEAGVETDAELPDQIGVTRGIAGQCLKKLARAGTRNGADVADNLFARHADAVVGNGDGARLLVICDGDSRHRIAAIQRIVGQSLKTQFIHRVRSI